MRIYCALFFLSLGFFIVHCEKETPVEPFEKMDTFYPEYNFQPLIIPQGIETSTDSMAQVVHGYLKLANSIEDNIKWVYMPPDEVMYDSYFSITRKNLPEYKMWTAKIRVNQRLEIYDGTGFVTLKVLDEESWYYWNSVITFYVNGKIVPLVEDFNYIESGAKKDFSAGYMRKVCLFNPFKFHCAWEWEMSDDFETCEMSVVLNDMSIEYNDWPQPETLPGKADIKQHKSGSGEMKYYMLGDHKFIFHFSAQWDSLGKGEYQIYNPDASQIIHQGAW